MKRLTKITLIGIFILSANAFANPFSGTWKLVAGEYINHEGVLVNYQDLNLSSIKVITNRYFSFVSMSGDKFWSSGTGKFSYTNDEYIEVPIYTSYKTASGKTYTFSYQLLGDIWHNARWENGLRVEYETWQRIE
ncbi:hypothetical protein C2869_06330 [Saccharobesus litoralis]|uniref:DUF4488 domain-containing protein n=1 Tax=Saccharobesus litoralis TaxID=2172099 RepID=A0A2S0VPS2_9ALTE|nr:hypothetical protein [Saccharobesus litoralis]AWB66080.1 hypothetical protein C2869_06330 [Saccharobesus litoralis]